jgi:16S rRNA (guanine966-N2)-methyltransferase
MIPAVAKHPRELPSLGGRGSVRIIGGAWRGRRIAFPDLPDLRPTPDRVRETLFNWLQHELAGARCLDLFAGSGALGLEALSRGAKELVLVEDDPAAARNLTEQIQRLEAFRQASVVEMDAYKYLLRPAEPFDIIFVDPPFKSDAIPGLTALLDAGAWLRTGSLVYLESPRELGVPTLPERWDMLKSKSAGEVGYYLARIQGQQSP